jgi:hypothetical protein
MLKLLQQQKIISKFQNGNSVLPMCILFFCYIKPVGIFYFYAFTRLYEVCFLLFEFYVFSERNILLWS